MKIINTYQEDGVTLKRQEKFIYDKSGKVFSKITQDFSVIPVAVIITFFDCNDDKSCHVEKNLLIRNVDVSEFLTHYYSFANVLYNQTDNFFEKLSGFSEIKNLLKNETEKISDDAKKNISENKDEKSIITDIIYQTNLIFVDLIRLIKDNLNEENLSLYQKITETFNNFFSSVAEEFSTSVTKYNTLGNKEYLEKKYSNGKTYTENYQYSPDGFHLLKICVKDEENTKITTFNQYSVSGHLAVKKVVTEKINGEKSSVEYTYNAAGVVSNKKIINPNGAIENQLYDFDWKTGALISLIKTNSFGKQISKTTFDYYPSNKAVKTISVQNYETNEYSVTEYDKNGNVVSAAQ